MIPVPDDIPDEIALLAILSNDVRKGIEKLRLLPDARVLVTGSGAIGLLTLYWLRVSGFPHVDVVEPLEARRALARVLGARAAYSPSALPAAARYEAGIECSSRQAAFALLQRRLIQNGQICVLSDGNLEPLVLEPEFHSRELTVVGSSDGVDYAGHARRFFEAWRRTKAPLAELFTWRVNAADLSQAFERMLEQAPLKVFVTYP